MCKCNGALAVCLHDCDAVPVAVEDAENWGPLNVVPAVAVEACTEETARGQVGISFALYREVRVVVCG